MLTIQPGHSPNRDFPRQLARHGIALCFLGVLSLVTFFVGLERRALWSSHEGRAGQHAQLMLDTRQWGMPTLYYGEADYQKPPLYYWLVAAVSWCRGGIVDEWAVRLPAAVSALLGVWLIYWAGAAWWRPSAGFVAALILATTLRYGWLARVGRIDMPLTLAVSLALVSFVEAYKLMPSDREATRSKMARWLLVAYLSVALAIMLKGPIGIVLPAVTVILFLAIERQPVFPGQPGFRTLMGRLGIWWGLPLVAILVSPWFIWATVTTGGEFFKTFFLHHHLDRTLGVEGLKPGPFWYYIPQIMLDAFPWSLLIPFAIWQAVRCRENRLSMPGRFALCWITAVLALLSVVRFKRHDYLLPALPGLALFLAGSWDRLRCEVASARSWRWARLVPWGMVLLAASLAGARWLLVDGALVSRLLDSSIVKRLVDEPDRVLVGKACRALAEVSGWGTVALVASFLAATTGVILAHRTRSLPTAVMVAVAWTLGFRFYVAELVPRLEPMREQRTMAELARQFSPPHATLYYYGREDQQLMFYLGSDSKWLPNRTALRPVILGTDPAFVLMERERYEIRKQDWRDVTLVPLAENTANVWGVHENPTVLVANAAGWRLVESRRRSTDPAAN